MAHQFGRHARVVPQALWYLVQTVAQELPKQTLQNGCVSTPAVTCWWGLRVVVKGYTLRVQLLAQKYLALKEITLRWVLLT
jgi:hypothetical protein